jgi:hypothetical protein
MRGSFFILRGTVLLPLSGRHCTSERFRLYRSVSGAGTRRELMRDASFVHSKIRMHRETT